MDREKDKNNEEGKKRSTAKIPKHAQKKPIVLNWKKPSSDTEFGKNNAKIKKTKKSEPTVWKYGPAPIVCSTTFSYPHI